MLKSMTGYGRREAVTEGKKILVEIKSVNHRYADFLIKTPRIYNFLEDKIRRFAADKHDGRQATHIRRTDHLRIGQAGEQQRSILGKCQNIAH